MAGAQVVAPLVHPGVQAQAVGVSTPAHHNDDDDDDGDDDDDDNDAGGPRGTGASCGGFDT